LRENSGRDCSKLPCSAESPTGAQRRTRQKKVGEMPQIVLPDKQITKSNTFAVRISRIIDYFYILIDK